MDHTNSNLPSITIDVEEKSNNALSQKPSVKSYAARVLQESTVGIVSSIFTTNSKYRRFFKIFLSSLCIAGFVYHCAAFLHHVLGYPEVVNISSDRSGTYIWPAFSYCSNNPIRRSVFCSTYPQYCMKPGEEFCKKYSSYCGANATLVPIEEYYYKLPPEIRFEWLLNLGSVPNVLQLNESYIDGEKKEEISGPFLRFRKHALMPCYSIHSRVEINQQPLQKTRDRIWVRSQGPQKNSITLLSISADATVEKTANRVKNIPIDSFLDEFLEYYINETEMINPRIEPGIYFSVHSPFEFANPFQKGIFLKSGREYNLYVEMEQEILLKDPFQSNCMDYEELWENNNRTGPRTKMMCKEKCSLEFALNWKGCTDFYVLYPHKERICGDESSRNLTTARPVIENFWELYSNCLENCRDECRSSKYTTELYIRDQDKKEFVEDDELHGRIEVKIFLSNDKVKVLRHSPKYETVDVISSVGGFMGCWLGIALLDILDVFGSIITIFRYSFRKRLYTQKKLATEEN